MSGFSIGFRALTQRLSELSICSTLGNCSVVSKCNDARHAPDRPFRTAPITLSAGEETVNRVINEPDLVVEDMLRGIAAAVMASARRLPRRRGPARLCGPM